MAKYKSAPLAPAAREIYARFPFVSSVDHSVQYRTTIYTDGNAHCTCEGFRFRENCKHVEALRTPTAVIRTHM
jgi:hypothetical protein